MNKEVNCRNLSVGMEIKNYKYLCELVNEEVKSGKSKKYQLEHWKCYFDFEKVGQKIIITKIFDEPHQKEDKRKTRHYQHGVECYNINHKFDKCKGVYCISNKSTNELYIGSTIDSFRHRFNQHYSKNNTKIYNCLHNGGKFSILWIASNNDSNEDICKQKQIYIDKALKSNWTILNIQKAYALYKYEKLIKVSVKDIKQINQLTKQNSIEKITNNYVYFKAANIL